MVLYLKHNKSENIARVNEDGQITFHDKLGRQVKDTGGLNQEMALKTMKVAGWEVFERLSA